MDRDNNWYNGNNQNQTVNQQDNIQNNMYEQAQANNYTQQSMLYQQQMQGQYYQNQYYQNTEQQQNTYQQQGQMYGTHPNMYQQQIPYTPPIKSKKNKSKKKKKHKFLRFLFKTTILILLIVGIIKGSNYLAEKEMDKVVKDYPFTFSNETNSLNYITDDFKVITQYELDGKTYNVKWKSDDKSLKISDNGEVTVTRPSDTSRTVILTQTYKKLLGKAEKTYELYVVSTGTINTDTLDIVTLEEVKNNEYNRDMTASMTTDGESLDFLMGDFKNVTVNSVEDALIIVNAYRGEFNVLSEISFKLDRITDSDIYKAYIFKAYLDDEPFDNKGATVTVKVDSNKLNAIAIDKIEIPKLISEEPDITEIIKRYDLEIQADTSEFEIIKEEKLINNDGYVYSYTVLFKDRQSYELKVQNNELIESRAIVSNISNLEMEKVICTGYDESGKKLTFEANYVPSINAYVLNNPNKGIEVYRNIGGNFATRIGGELVKDEFSLPGAVGMMSALYGLVWESLIGNNLNIVPSSETAEFNKDFVVEVQAYDSIQRAYDYFHDTFGLQSFDDNGAPVKVLCDYDASTDGAAWHSEYKLFIVHPSDRWLYSVTHNPEIMCHEYTHSVFGAKVAYNNIEINGLNESYADTFACIMNPEVNWVVGTNTFARDIKLEELNKRYRGTPQGEKIYGHKGQEFIMRDLVNINNDKTAYYMTYPEKYHDKKWEEDNGEEHGISIMISNIAYKLIQSEYFTPDDIANIWYAVLSSPWSEDSTYVTFRQFVIATAEDKHYSDEAIDFIAKCFDEADIFDPEYIYKTTSNAKEGDTVLDDSTPRKYIVAFSPADLILGDGTIAIYEESGEKVGFSKDKEAAEQVANLINTKYPKLNIHGSKIQVDYTKASPLVMGVAEKFCQNSKNTIKNMSLEAMERSNVDVSGETMEIFNYGFDKLFSLIFHWQMLEVTPYELYDSFGLIE